MIRKTLFTLFMLIGIVLLASCNPAQISPTAQANMPNPTSAPTETPTATQEFDSQSTSPTPPSDNATVLAPAQVVINEPLDYCFAYPQGFTQQINDSQVEVAGPHAPLDFHPGLVWINATDAQGRTAQEIADEEVNAFGGSPPRWTVMLGGEEALVLDGMPGQDPIQKVYIVHNGLLYTLNFSPYQSDYPNASNAQVEILFASVTSSWVWMSSGQPCPASEASSNSPAGGATSEPTAQFVETTVDPTQTSVPPMEPVRVSCPRRPAGETRA